MHLEKSAALREVRRGEATSLFLMEIICDKEARGHHKPDQSAHQSVLYLSCLYIKEKVDLSKAQVLLISACNVGMYEFNMPCTSTHVDTRLVKGLAVVSFQIVNYTQRRPCCSLNVISQPDKCYLGNMTGMTFFGNTLPHTDEKALLILSPFLSPSLSLHKLMDTRTHSSTHCSSHCLSLGDNPRCASSLACIHTHKPPTGLHCRIS